jgi:hypothetical protein
VGAVLGVGVVVDGEQDEVAGGQARRSGLATAATEVGSRRLERR